MREIFPDLRLNLLDKAAKTAFYKCGGLSPEVKTCGLNHSQIADHQMLVEITVVSSKGHLEAPASLL